MTLNQSRHRPVTTRGAPDVFFASEDAFGDPGADLAELLSDDLRAAGMTSADVPTRCHVSAGTVEGILHRVNRPGWRTIVRLGCRLHLGFEGTNDLLAAAGLPTLAGDKQSGTKTRPRVRRLLEEHMRAKGMTAYGLHNASHVDDTHIGRILDGRRGASYITILMLCLGLGLEEVEADELLMAAGFAPLSS